MRPSDCQQDGAEVVDNDCTEPADPPVAFMARY